MTAKFLHLSFNFEGRPPRTKAIETELDKALDWIQYAPNCYLLYTLRDAQIWYSRLKKKVREDDSIFVVELNMENRQGWLPTEVWEWIQKDRSTKT
jgi:hypothetical protein